MEIRHKTEIIGVWNGLYEYVSTAFSFASTDEHCR